MSTKKKTPSKPKPKASDAIEKTKLLAKLTIKPELSSAKIITTLQGGQANFDELCVMSHTIEAQLEDFHKDNKSIEKILYSQSMALNALFEYAAQRIPKATVIEQLQAWSTLALKAQNNCRNTLATLADIKKPKQAAVFIKNNNAINQQLNQQIELKETENFSNLENELLSIPKKEKV